MDGHAFASTHSPAASQAPGAAPEPPPVREFEPGDLAGVLALLQRAFGVWPGTVAGADPEEYFRWKLLECPFGRAMMTLAELDETVVGFQARLPWRLRCGGRVVPSMRVLDLAVHPEYRRRGISLAVRQSIPFPDDVDIGWGNPNRASRRGTLKLIARDDLPSLPEFMRPVRPLRAAARRLAATPARDGGGSDASPRIDARSAAEVLADGEYVQRVLARLEPPRDRYVTDRDLAYLRWRYTRYGDYRALRSTRGAPAIAIFRLRRHAPFWVADVSELLVASGERAATRRLLRGTARASAADLLYCAFPSLRSALGHGFARIPGDTILTAGPKAGRHVSPDPEDPGSWALSHGDIELL